MVAQETAPPVSTFHSGRVKHRKGPLAGPETRSGCFGREGSQVEAASEGNGDDASAVPSGDSALHSGLTLRGHFVWHDSSSTTESNGPTPATTCANSRDGHHPRSKKLVPRATHLSSGK